MSQIDTSTSGSPNAERQPATDRVIAPENDLNIPDPTPLAPAMAPAVDLERIQSAVREILIAIGEDPDR
ncbi:MAG: hypothetical protein WD029_07165, partial [Microthrixaceae bacterium]